MKLMILLTFLINSSLSAQIVKDKNGNYVQSQGIERSKETGKTFTTNKGEKFNVYLSVNGKPYVIRKSKRTGNEYKQYLKVK